MRKIGVLYDNISGNTGDAAIGLSVKKILRNIGVSFEELVPGRFNPKNYETIIIGGGDLLRPSPDFFYDKFRGLGNHILNACGIVGSPSDLHYLDDYLYLSVRSEGDRRKLGYLKKEVKVVPCTSMLLDEAKGFSLPIKKPCIGMHLDPGINLLRTQSDEPLVEWISSLGRRFNVYLLPMTYYVHDFTYMRGLCSKVHGCELLPVLKPRQVLKTIGQFDYFVSSSMHGAIFSYMKKVPFIALDLEKIRFFMQDRGLERYLFRDIEGMTRAFDSLADGPDYSPLLAQDYEKLRQHVRRMKNILRQKRAKGLSVATKKIRRRDSTQETDSQVQNLQLQVIDLSAQLRKQEEAFAPKSDPLSKLLLLYRSRLDLQSAFPEVGKGDYSRLLDWARLQAVSGEDAAHLLLARDALWYEANPWHGLSELSGELNRTRTALSQRESSVQVLEAERSKLSEELNRTKREFEIVRHSFGYKLMRFYASRIDRLFPQGTSRGELRKIATTSLRVITEQGLRSFFAQAWSKIGRREFKIVEPTPDLRTASSKEINEVLVEMMQMSPEDIDRISSEIASFKFKPRISVITPVYNTDVRWLKRCLDSVISQICPEWELCIADDASDNEEVRSILREHAARDRRIKVRFLDKHLGIAGASNEALSLATGDFVAFLDHDDELTRDALYEVVRFLNTNPEFDLVYTDEGHIDEAGNRSDPFFKPDWSPDLLLSYNYMPHLSVYRRSIVQDIGGFRFGFDGSQDYDLVLRFTERTDRIGHVPRILYGWRKAKGSVSRSLDAKLHAYEAAVRALEDAVRRRGFDADVKEILAGGRYRVRYAIRGKPLVSILIPTKSSVLTRSCLRSLARSTYDNLEVLVLDSSKENELEKIAANFRNCRVLRYEDSAPFNFSKINNWGASMARGEYLIFLNDDTEVIEPDWIEALLEHAQRPGVGAVGAKLLYPDGLVQHAGIILGLRGPAEHYAGIRGDDRGYYDLAAVVRNCSAVTAACMMVNKQLFIDQGMFDEALGRAWQDVDFCLRLGKAGYRTVYTPFACLMHRHGATRGIGDKSPDEDKARDIFRRRWDALIESGDRYYNPNLSTERPYEIGFAALAVQSRFRGPLQLLLGVFSFRRDLQSTFPEVNQGDYLRLLNWVVSWGITKDSSRPLLSQFADWYRNHLKEITENPSEMKPISLARSSEEIEPFSAVEHRRLILETSSQPTVSIIVVTRNRFAYTWKCLSSLSRIGKQDNPFEIIVIDNASTDETPSFLKGMVEGIQVVLNDENRGFGAACNQAAGSAKGQYLLFLNNDTIIQPNTIKSLVDTIARDSSIGAVGGKLIYPGGLLQEAGSIIWRDGTTLAFGRGDIPTRSSYSYVRDVDYCSASCLLVRRSLFDEVGGFDDRYSPAYYEDADLCMAMKTRGYRVVFQPEAEVVHFEYGTSTPDKARGLMLQNQPTFLEKWRRALSDYPIPKPTDQLAVIKAADRQLGQRILVVDDKVAGLEGAGYSRMYRLLTLLRRLGHTVTLMPMEFESMKVQIRRLQQASIEVFTGSRQEQTKFLKDMGKAFDAVILSRPPVFREYADEVRMYCRDARLVFDSEALWFTRTLRQASITSNAARARQLVKMAAEEFQTQCAAFVESGLVFAISDADKEEIVRLVPKAQVIVIPNIHDIPQNIRSAEQRKDLLLVGGFLGGEGAPSTDAVIFFVQNIWPIIEKKLPEIQLHIVGANPPASVRKLQSRRINVTGRVGEDVLAKYYQNCKIGVIPLRVGAGLKNKVTESMAYGLPIVTTPVGAEGTKLIDQESAFIRDDPNMFATDVVQLYQNHELWMKFSHASQELAEQHFSEKTVSARLKEVFSNSMLAESY